MVLFHKLLQFNLSVVHYFNFPIDAPTPVPTPAPRHVTAPAPVFIPTGQTPPDRVEDIKGIRKAMVKAMTEALSIPHFGYCDEISMDDLVV